MGTHVRTARVVASVMQSPTPMLYRPGSLPEFGNWAFKVKWDGFRTLVLRRDKSEQSPRVEHDVAAT